MLTPSAMPQLPPSTPAPPTNPFAAFGVRSTGPAPLPTDISPIDTGARMFPPEGDMPPIPDGGTIDPNQGADALGGYLPAGPTGTPVSGTGPPGGALGGRLRRVGQSAGRVAPPGMMRRVGRGGPPQAPPVY